MLPRRPDLDLPNGRQDSSAKGQPLSHPDYDARHHASKDGCPYGVDGVPLDHARQVLPAETRATSRSTREGLYRSAREPFGRGA